MWVFITLKCDKKDTYLVLWGVLMRRSRLEIVFKILEVSQNGSNKTNIVYSTYLNFKMAQNYINFLIEAKLLSLELQEGKKIYHTTEKGKEMLNKYRELSDKISRAQ